MSKSESEAKEENEVITNVKDMGDFERINSFRSEFSFNNDNVRKFKRWKKRSAWIDKFGVVAIVLGLATFAISIKLKSIGPKILYQAGSLLSIVIFGTLSLSGFIGFIHSIALWHSDLSSDAVAAYELNQALTEYLEEDEYDTSTITHHIEEAQKYLSYSNKHKLISPRHSDGIQEYASQIITAKSPEKEISETFPRLIEIAVYAFSFPNTNSISNLAKNIESDPTHTPSQWEEIKEDGRSLVQFFITGDFAPIVVAIALGIVTGFSFGLWRGATVFFGVITIYSLIHDKLNR